MKKNPIVRKRLGIDWTKWFFPSLVAQTAYRYIFRHRERNVKFDPVKAQKLTNALSLGYVLFASTAAGLTYYIYRNSGAAYTGESTAAFYARTCLKDRNDPTHKMYRVKVFDMETEEIGDEVRKRRGYRAPDENYDPYSDPAYIRQRLNVKEGSKKDESFNMEVAGLYLKRVDKMNRLNKTENTT